MSAAEWVGTVAVIVGALALLTLAAAAVKWWIEVIIDAYGFVEKAFVIAVGLFVISLVTLFIVAQVLR